MKYEVRVYTMYFVIRGSTTYKVHKSSLNKQRNTTVPSVSKENTSDFVVPFNLGCEGSLMLSEKFCESLLTSTDTWWELYRRYIIRENVRKDMGCQIRKVLEEDEMRKEMEFWEINRARDLAEDMRRSREWYEGGCLRNPIVDRMKRRACSGLWYLPCITWIRR
jgi:hypothetical protein